MTKPQRPQEPQEAADLEPFMKKIEGILGGFAERLEILEDDKRDGHQRGEAAVIIANKAFDSDKDEILEWSRISYAAVDPLVDALTLDDMFAPDVLNGEMSLARKSIIYLLKLSESVKGWNREMGMEALKAQLQSATAAEEEARRRLL